MAPTPPGASATEAWRRHPADLARLVFAALAAAALAIVAAFAPGTVAAVSTDLIRLFRELPAGFIAFLVGFVQLLAILAPVVFTVALLWRRSQREFAAVAVGAAIAGVAVALLDSWLASRAPTAAIAQQRVDSWFTGAAFPSSAYLAAAAAAATVASPSWARPWRRAAWLGVTAIAACRLLTATEVPLNLALVVALGVVAGSAVLLVTGAASRRVDIATVSDALRRNGVIVHRLEPRPSEIATPTFTAQGPAGEPYLVKVLGRDERDESLFLRAWQAISVRGMGDHRPVRSPTRAAEHEALALTLARAATARVPEVIGIGYTDDGAAVFVQALLPGIPLAETPTNVVDDELLTDAWRQVAALQTRRIAHRALDSRNIVVADGAAVVGFGAASLNGSDQLIAADVAELIVSTALLVGAERAVTCAATVMSKEILAAALPLMQPVVLTPRTRRALKPQPDVLNAAREATRAAAGVDSYELTKLHRITLQGAVTAVGSVALFGYLLNLVANWGEIWDALRTADSSAFVPLLLLIVLSYVGGALSLMGAVTIDLPFLRTTEVMFAQSFLNRFTPANSGGMAMRVRYLQRQGSDLTVAAASVGLTSAASGVAQVFFVGLFFVWGGTSDALGSFSLPRKGTMLAVLVGAGVVIGIVAESGWGRRVVVPIVRRTVGKALGAFRELGRRPSRLALLFGGAALSKFVIITAFVASVHAFGVSMGFAQAGALYMVANTVGSAVPTPGGVGGLEAALTAALLGAGVAGATAAAIVVLFRLATYWLPTLPGWLFLQHSQRSGIV
jgi:uncharacterized membrane protein YbhN (UPF0104 family)